MFVLKRQIILIYYVRYVCNCASVFVPLCSLYSYLLFALLSYNFVALCFEFRSLWWKNLFLIWNSFLQFSFVLQQSFRVFLLIFSSTFSTISIYPSIPSVLDLFFSLFNLLVVIHFEQNCKLIIYFLFANCIGLRGKWLPENVSTICSSTIKCSSFINSLSRAALMGSATGFNQFNTLNRHFILVGF